MSDRSNTATMATLPEDDLRPETQQEPDLLRGLMGNTSEAARGMSARYNIANHQRRTELLRRMGSQKRNTLAVKNENTAEGLTPDEMHELQALTRLQYESMRAVQIAQRRFIMTLIDVFGEKSPRVKQLVDLSHETMGKYLNTHQYHNAEHMFTMTRDVLHLADIAEYNDEQTRVNIIIGCLYHDAGNGVRPAAAGTDELDAVRILDQDIRLSRENTKPELVSLNDLKPEQLVDIYAAMAATTFRDRHGLPAFQKNDANNPDADYIRKCVELLQGQGVSITNEEFAKKMNGMLAALFKNGDIMSSLLALNSIKNNLGNRREDDERDPTAKMFRPHGPAGYHKGFVEFITATAPWMPKEGGSESMKEGRAGNPFYVPEGNKEAVAAYGKKLLLDANLRMEKILNEHNDMLTLLYVIIAENRDGKTGNIMEMKVADIGKKLLSYVQDPAINQKVKAALDNVTQPITLTEAVLRNKYPLLFDDKFANNTIADLPSGIVNRIFAPAAARVVTEAEETRFHMLVRAGEFHDLQQTDDELRGVAPSFRQSVSGINPRFEKNDQLWEALNRARNVTGTGPKAGAEQWNILRKAGLDVNEVIELAWAGFITLEHATNSDIYESAADELLELSEHNPSAMIFAIADTVELCPQLVWKETFKKGEAIITKGDNPQRVMVIAKGHAKVIVPNKAQTDDVGVGDVIGEMSALSKEGTAGADVIAESDVEVISVPASELNDYANANMRAAALDLRKARLEFRTIA